MACRQSKLRTRGGTISCKSMCFYKIRRRVKYPIDIYIIYISNSMQYHLEDLVVANVLAFL